MVESSGPVKNRGCGYGCFEWLYAGFLLFGVLGVLHLIGGLFGDRPSAIHDPQGYSAALGAPSMGCVCILICVGGLLFTGWIADLAGAGKPSAAPKTVPADGGKK